ncbi:MAG: low molecular weight phosphotyrosine protein phosphatase [Gammaproteobacteria bacterium]|nr:low molecular weight phosphotyrosine protein phosphatase [Gammaproteobacteria bacterium]
MGNICRSPTAEGVFRKLHQELAPQLKLHIASAGTHAYHVGEPPDRRSQMAARRRGIDIGAHRGRVLTTADFTDFHYILAMDEQNLQELRQIRPQASCGELRLLLEFADGALQREVPDPYYCGPSGFEAVLDLVELGSLGLIRHICREQGFELALPREAHS